MILFGTLVLGILLGWTGAYFTCRSYVRTLEFNCHELYDRNKNMVPRITLLRILMHGNNLSQAAAEYIIEEAEEIGRRNNELNRL